MLLIGLPGHYVALGSDYLRRTVPSRSNRLGFVEFNRLPVIDFRPERHFNRINVALERIR